MADRVAEFLIGLGLDGAEVKGLFAAVKSQLKSDVAELQSIADKLDLFGQISDNLPKVQRALDSARAEALKFKEQIDAIKKAGGDVPKELVDSFKRAEAAAKSAGSEFAKETRTANALSIELSAAGVQTTKFAAEQTRLADAVKKASAELLLQQSKDLLGFKSLGDVKPKIDELNRAFAVLRDSGKLSASELAAAQGLLAQRVAEVRSEVTTTANVARAGRSDLVKFFTDAALPAAGLTLSVAGVVTALKDAVKAAADYQQRLAEISTVTKLSRDQIDALGVGARTLSKELGIGVDEALRGVFELLRSGVPRENVLEVLRASSLAAKAGLAEVGDGVKATGLLLDNFGAQAGELPGLFDKITVGAKNGGATFAEFAANGGALLNVARAARVDFDSLLAVLTVMVDKSGNAEKSFADLTKILAKLGTDEVRAKLESLGIESTNLVEVFQRLGERGVTLSQALGIDLTGAGTKSAASIATLTTNAGELPKVLEAIRESAGATSEAVNTLAETPTERMKKLTTATSDLQTQFGLLLTSFAPLLEGVTFVIRSFTELEQVQRTGVVTGTVYDNAISRWSASLFGVKPAATDAATGVKQLGDQAKESTPDLAAIGDQLQRLNRLGTELAANSKAISDALAADLAELNTRAQAQLDALDKSKAAQSETAKATLEIQQKLADDKLALIRKNEAEITKATEAALAARALATKNSAAEELKYAREATALRVGEVQRFLGAYREAYNEQTRIAQAAAARLQSIEEARVGIQRGIEAEIRNIRLAGLSGLDVFVERNREIDRLISEGRKAAARGDIETARTFFEQAKTEAGQLARVVSVTGAEVISATQAQQAKVEALRKVSDAVNESFAEQGEAARKGAEAAALQQDKLRQKIADLERDLKNLKEASEQQIQLSISDQIIGIEAAEKKLAELTRPRVVPIIVDTSAAAGLQLGTGALPQLIPQNRGGFIGQAPQRFAEGGAVWKVPGFGDRDTVPAMLREGSFVLRKSAVERYFPGYAMGGNVLNAGAAALRILTGLGFGNLSSGASGAGADDLQSWVTPANVIAYAKAVLDLLRGSPVASLVAQDISSRIRYVGSHPGDGTALQELLNSAAALGLNAGLADFYGKTSAPESVRPGLSFAAFVAMIKSGQIARPSALFAAGGAATDTVPALLTPGEFVISPEASRAIGSDMLHALNQRLLPDDILSRLARGPAMPRGYATGGAVPGAAIPRTGGGGGIGNVYVTVNAAGGDVENPAVARRLAETIRSTLERRSR